MDHEKVIERLMVKIKKRKLTPAYFDDFVHQTASNEAAKLNNKGLVTQINYLLNTGWSKSDIEKLFE